MIKVIEVDGDRYTAADEGWNYLRRYKNFPLKDEYYEESKPIDNYKATKYFSQQIKNDGLFIVDTTNNTIRWLKQKYISNNRRYKDAIEKEVVVKYGINKKRYLWVYIKKNNVCTKVLKKDEFVNGIICLRDPKIERQKKRIRFDLRRIFRTVDYSSQTQAIKELCDEENIDPKDIKKFISGDLIKKYKEYMIFKLAGI